MGKAIKVENLSKAYQIGEFSTGTLSRDIERWWALARGKEDPFLVKCLTLAIDGSDADAIRETIEVFRGNAEAADIRDAAYRSAALAQFGGEFRELLGLVPLGGFSDILAGVGITQAHAHAIVVHAEGAEDDLHQFDAAEDLLCDLVFCHEQMGIVLGESSDAGHA